MDLQQAREVLAKWKPLLAPEFDQAVDAILAECDRLTAERERLLGQIEAWSELVR